MFLVADPLVPSHQRKEIAAILNLFTLIVMVLGKVWSKNLKLLRNRRFGGSLLDFSQCSVSGTLISVTADNGPFLCLTVLSVNQ